MRTRTNLDIALLSAPSQARSVWAKVEIDATGSGAWVDLTNWNGLDWLISWSYGEDINTAGWRAQFQFHHHQADNPALSLSPHMADSRVNASGVLIKEYRKIRLSTATVPQDAERPTSYNLVFRGRIDTYDMSGGVITVSCRDQCGDLQDRIIKTEKEYGSDTPTTATANELQELAQNIIDDHYNLASDIGGTASGPRANKLSARTTDGAPYQIYSANGTAATPWNAGDDTGWSLRLFTADKSTVWSWIERLAQMIGYVARFRYHEGSGIDDIVLVIEAPDRSSPSSAITLDPSAGQCAIASVSGSITNIRNFWRIGYSLYGGTSDNEEASDATSISDHGERFAEVIVGSASQIDTSTEAASLAARNLADTKDPIATVSLSCPYMWYLQLNDIVTVAADDYYFSSSKSLCLVGRQNTGMQGGPAMTQLTLHGSLQTSGTRKRQRAYEKARTDYSNSVGLNTNTGGLVANGSFADNLDE